jgi:hypothetical protein
MQHHLRSPARIGRSRSADPGSDTRISPRCNTRLDGSRSTKTKVALRLIACIVLANLHGSVALSQTATPSQSRRFKRR